VNVLPNIKSAIKRVKVSEAKNLRNRMIKSQVRTTVKKLEVAIASKNDAAKMLPATVATIDKAAAKGAISKNAANRKKARLARRITKAQQA